MNSVYPLKTHCLCIFLNKMKIYSSYPGSLASYMSFSVPHKFKYPRSTQSNLPGKAILLRIHPLIHSFPLFKLAALFLCDSVRQSFIKPALKPLDNVLCYSLGRPMNHGMTEAVALDIIEDHDQSRHRSSSRTFACVLALVKLTKYLSR